MDMDNLLPPGISSTTNRKRGIRMTATPDIATDFDVDPEHYRAPRRYPDPFCNSRHPRKGDECRRLKGHDGDHAAFTFLISQPETWAALPEGTQK